MRLKLYPTFPFLAGPETLTGAWALADGSPLIGRASVGICPRAPVWKSSCQPELHLRSRSPDRFQMLPLLPSPQSPDWCACVSITAVAHPKCQFVGQHSQAFAGFPDFRWENDYRRAPYWQNAPTVSLLAAVFHTIHKLLTALYCTNANQLSKTPAHCGSNGEQKQQDFRKI